MPNVVIAIFPPSEMEIDDFDVIDCVPSGLCEVVEDEELFGKSVIEIPDTASHITFFGNTRYTMVVMHANCGGRFFSMKISAVDSTGKERVLVISNKKTSVTVTGNECTVPLKVGNGWQRLCINLDDMLTRAFGSRLQLISKVVVYGSCRISKLYYQNKDYADAQLPSYLRVGALGKGVL